MREWKRHTFGELIDSGVPLLSDGYRAKLKELGGNGPMFLRAGHVSDSHIDFTDVEQFHAKLEPRVRGKMSQPGDVVITTKGNSTGRVTYISESMPPFVYSPHLSFWRSLKSNTLVAGFLRYWSRGEEFQQQLRALAGATDMAPYLSLVDQRRLRLTLPSPDEQRTIAAVLGALDDKIELNRRMNETLEAMARALFQNWFLYATQAGLPKGWRESTIRELASNIQYGLTQSASTEPVGPRFLRITDIQGGRVDWDSVPFCKVSPEEHDRYRLKPGDVLVARTGASTGENIYLSVVPDAVFASYLVRFQFNDPAMARLVGAFMRTPAYFDFVAGCIGGSAQPNASAQVLAGAELPVPTPELAKRFADLLAPLDQRIAANNEESRTLAALRDALLPKLLSGELRVPAA